VFASSQNSERDYYYYCRLYCSMSGHCYCPLTSWQPCTTDRCC